MSDDIGYCTVDDVRRAWQRAEFSRGLEVEDNQAVVDAITSQAEWLQEHTNRHWYAPDGLEEDDHDIIPTEPLTHSEDELDIPSSPHAGPQQMQVAASRQARYPVRHAGPYTRVKLSRRDVVDMTELLVRDNSGNVTDWVSEYARGRGKDYYLNSDDSSGFTYLYLHCGTLPKLRDYDNAVVATYEWGIDELSNTVRRAIAMRALAQLLTDDDSALGIPEDANLVPAESKIQALERQAEELLGIHE
ncbi:hypothetical protein RBH26_20595 [Natronolimnohabitans sp. A-GB9]|uniref:hypothetical protein n=1 Tax=Natronolimnohabitans sp. A-GB9 TaxID=3069757 RepID=UPI0027AE5359|nr:hypothetical protein [Natronolimnohabitans sp. A-GB9]MDQ2052844.1 hypothetical protein [Natronolimnohabitans sp. A-GB9]